MVWWGGELAEGRTEGRKGNDDDASKEGEEDETRARARRGRSEPVHIKVDKAWAPSFLQATELQAERYKQEEDSKPEKEAPSSLSVFLVHPIYDYVKGTSLPWPSPSIS